ARWRRSARGKRRRGNTSAAAQLAPTRSAAERASVTQPRSGGTLASTRVSPKSMRAGASSHGHARASGESVCQTPHRGTTAASPRKRDSISARTASSARSGGRLAGAPTLVPLERDVADDMRLRKGPLDDASALPLSTSSELSAPPERTEEEYVAMRV